MMTDAQHDHPEALELSRRALGWLRVVNIIYAVGICVMLALSIVNPRFLFGALSVRADPWDAVTLAMRGIMVAGLAGAFVAHRILTELMRIVESVQTGDPFVLRNAARLQAIAWWLLGGELLHLLIGVLAKMASTTAQPFDIDWTFSFTPWISVLLPFVLARVFAHGARMREELEGTV